MKLYYEGLVLFLLVFSMGWCGCLAYEAFSNSRTINGIFLKNYNLSERMETLSELDRHNSDWVCVNTFKMDIPEAYETCVHECTHVAYSEILAEECEDNYETCDKFIEEKLNGN